VTGTINVSRNLFDDTAFKPEPFTEREAWLWMIMEASYKARSKPVGNLWVDTERGQLASSVRFMAEAWGWSKSKVDRFIKRLENRDMIGTESGTGINVITICKYDEYQNAPNQIGTAKSKKRDSSGTAAGQQRDKPNKGLIQDVIQEKEDTSVSLSASPTSDVAAAVQIFNQAAIGAQWPAVQKMNPTRTKSLKARLADAGGIDGWRTAIQKAERSDFLCGRTERPWQGFGFDWLIKPANFTKIMEGNYDQSTGNQSSGTPQGRKDRPDPALENILRLAGVGAASGDGIGRA
jgi:hypothetical protein